MPTRGQIKTNARINLADRGVTFYSEDDLNDSIQDAYDDIAALTQCITKSVDLNFTAYTSYYDFKNNFSVADYMGTTAIFNYTSNLWLRDDMSLRDLDRIRRDWETWTGTPQFWSPSDPVRIAIAPKVTVNTNGVALGAFDSGSFSSAFYITGAAPTAGFRLYYWAVAPTLASDNDILLVASDFSDLFENYITGDLLEQAQEFKKAGVFWIEYYKSIEQYAERVKKNNKADLLMRV